MTLREGTNDYSRTQIECQIQNIVEISNTNSEVAYRAFFDALGTDKNFCADHSDIHLIDIQGRYIPVLNNGSCAYEFYSSNFLVLHDRVEQRVGVDAFVVIPEINRILSYNFRATGIISALNDSRLARRLNIIDGYSLLMPPNQILQAIRQYDSHLSALSYWQILSGIFKRLGLGNLTPDFEFWQSQYECDLALKFIKAPFVSYVAAERHLTKDCAPDSGRNRGIFREYENAHAPIDGELLIMGDSHSYTAMAQMSSFIFRKTYFFWINRSLPDSSHWQEIEKISRTCDFVLEEMSERFFMANFCRPVCEAASSPGCS